MKAIVIDSFGGPEVLQTVEMPIPEPLQNEVLIRVLSTSVNFADIQMRMGKYHAAGNLPLMPGLEAIGVIEQVGSEVQNLSIGATVIAFPQKGAYAEYIVADSQLTFELPKNANYKLFEGAALVSFTAYKLLMDVANLQPNENVVIHSAAGGIGTTATQIAKYYGARTVIGTVGNTEKKQVVLDAGADHVFSYNSEHLARSILEVTNNRGVDVILDPLAGINSTQGMDYLDHFGRMVIFGSASGQPAKFDSSQLHSSCRTITGFSIGTTRDKDPEQLQKVSTEIFHLINEGHININIGARYALDDAQLAHELIESRTSTGKVILEVH